MNKKGIKFIIIASILLIVIITLVAVFMGNLFNNTSSTSKISSGFSSETNKNGDTKITVSSVSCESGGTVIIPVKVSNNAGFMVCLLDFEYDNSTLEYDGYIEGDIVSDYQFNDDNGSLRFIGMSNNDVTADGTIVNLRFKVSNNTTKKSTKVKLNINENSICNYNEKFIKANAVNGTVTIK